MKNEKKFFAGVAVVVIIDILIVLGMFTAAALIIKAIFF